MSTSSQKLVVDYLAAAGDRRLEEAARYLADGAVLVFPQGRFDDLETMAAAMAGRYRTISKTYGTWDVIDADDKTIVVATGTLSGVNVHGVAFAGIRFCDRFVVRNGHISEQHVWNDLAESGVLEQTSSV
jgi:hypothetical protein